MEDERRKPKKIKQKRGLELFCLFGDSNSGLNRSIMFFY